MNSVPKGIAANAQPIPIPNALPAGRAAPTSVEGKPRASAGYMKNERTVVMAGWRPVRREFQTDVSRAFENAAARAMDSIQNSGWVAGMLDQSVSNVVGEGLRLKMKPDAEMLGMTETEAEQWGRLVEKRFQLWADNKYECDVEGRRTFGQMQAAQFKIWFATGEMLSESLLRRRPGRTYLTKLRLVSPYRLANKTDSVRNIVNGVIMDRDGMPIGYVVRRPGRFGDNEEFEVRAFDRFGRAIVTHIYDGNVGQVRGITPFVPALQVTRQFDQLADATLTAATLQTVFAATIKSELPTEEVVQGMITPQEQASLAGSGLSNMDGFSSSREGFYDASTIDVGVNGRISHLFPGDELKFERPENPNDNYTAFAKHLLREMSRCAGLTYESATGDFTDATYSSVRAGSGEIYQVTKYRRKNLIAPFCRTALDLFLEEEIDAGRIPFPGGLENYFRNRTAALRSEWRGTPKPQADDLKAAKSHEIYKRNGLMSDEMIANELGHDIDELYQQRAREMRLKEELGLPDQIDPNTGIEGNGDDEDEDEQRSET